MLYLGIDQHRNQLTVDLGNEQGELVKHRQVSTAPKQLEAFLDWLRELSESEGGFAAILEVCGFNDYLMKMLDDYGCSEIVLIQPQQRSRRKTDRRDARALRDLLWVNRIALVNGERLAGLRRVRPCTQQESEQRQITSLRRHLSKLKTKAVNKIHHILLKHNLQHDCPTKSIDTQRARQWLSELTLPQTDRLELDLLLAQWALLGEHVQKVQKKINQMHKESPAAMIVASVPGLRGYSSLAIASRIGDPKDFPRPSSLSNFFGLTPGCCNSGDQQRPGSITKEGSSLVRGLLSNCVYHVLRKDAWMREWYKRIKRRRGSGIARVAVMRRLVTIIWKMLREQTAYVPGGPAEVEKQRRIVLALET